VCFAKLVEEANFMGVERLLGYVVGGGFGCAVFVISVDLLLG
jgi:hypothetical protein